MTQVTVSEDIAAEAQAVWEILGDFTGIQVGGPITSFSTEGEGVGMTRNIGMANGTIVERLEELDQEKMQMSYRILNADAPLPVTDYSSTVRVSTTSAGHCHVNWVGTFEPRGAPEETAASIVKGIYTNFIAAARKATGG